MPKIEPYQQQTTAPRPPSRIPLLGPSTSTVRAAAVGQVLDSVQLAFEAKAASEVSQGLSSLAQESAPLLESLKGSAAIDAEGFTPDAMQAFDAKVNEIERGLTTRRAKQVFRERSARERRAFELEAQAFEATTRVASRISGFQQSADQLAIATEHDPDRWKERIAEQWELLNSMGLEPRTRLELIRQLESKVTTAAAIGQARRDPAGVLQQLATDTPADELFEQLSPQARDAARKAAEAQLINQQAAHILQAYEAGGTEAGRNALSALEESGLPPLMRNEVRGKVNEGVSRLREQRRQEHADDLAAIETALANDSAGAGTADRVQDLFELGALSPQQYATYIGRIEASIVQQAKEGAAARELGEALRSGLPLDPRNADHRKALAQSFKRDTQALGAMPGSEDWRATAAAYAARTRMLPEQAIAWTRQTTRSQDPAIAAAGAQFYGAIAAASPDAVGEIDADTKAFAATVNAMIEAGTPPARAVETARTNVFDLKPEIRERRRTEFQEHAKQSDAALASLVDRDFDPGLFSFPPAASAGLAADFAAQSERYFAKVGDITLARDLAWADLKRVYGPSRVNGDAVMIAFPPERFGVTPEEIRTDIGNFLKGNPQADGSRSEDIVVVPDAITLRQVQSALDGGSVQPSYKLLTKSGDLVLDRHGVPKRYTVPSGEELAQRLRAAEENAAAEAQAMIDELKRKRDKRRAEQRAWQAHHASGPGVLR